MRHLVTVDTTIVRVVQLTDFPESEPLLSMEHLVHDDDGRLVALHLLDQVRQVSFLQQPDQNKRFTADKFARIMSRKIK